MWRLPLAIVGCALGLAGPALGASSGALLWTALGGGVTCGVAIHASGAQPTQLLCSAKPVPAPKAKGVGDPGFVFLRSGGRPLLARLSQDSFAGSTPIALANASIWTRSPIGVTCTVSASAVHCTNGAHHGFTITKSAYHAF